MNEKELAVAGTEYLTDMINSIVNELKKRIDKMEPDSLEKKKIKSTVLRIANKIKQDEYVRRWS